MNKNEHVSKTSEMICSVQKLVEIVPGSSLSKFQATKTHITDNRWEIEYFEFEGIWYTNWDSFGDSNFGHVYTYIEV